jgi:hypothetical protein
VGVFVVADADVAPVAVEGTGRGLPEVEPELRVELNSVESSRTGVGATPVGRRLLCERNSRPVSLVMHVTGLLPSRLGRRPPTGVPGGTVAGSRSPQVAARRRRRMYAIAPGSVGSQYEIVRYASTASTARLPLTPNARNEPIMPPSTPPIPPGSGSVFARVPT